MLHTLAIILAMTFLAVFHKKLIILFLMLELSQLQWNTADKNITHITHAYLHFDLPHFLNPFPMPSLLLSDLCYSHSTQETAMSEAKHLQSLSQAPALTEMWVLDWEKGQAQHNTKEKCPPG